MAEGHHQVAEREALKRRVAELEAELAGRPPIDLWRGSCGHYWVMDPRNPARCQFCAELGRLSVLTAECSLPGESPITMIERVWPGLMKAHGVALALNAYSKGRQLPAELEGPLLAWAEAHP